MLRLEDEPLDPAICDIIFRSVHTLKGGAGAIPKGKWLAQLGHSFESCLTRVKKGQLKVTSEIMELFLVTSDLCHQLVNLIKNDEEPSHEMTQSIQTCIAHLDALKAGQHPVDAAAVTRDGQVPKLAAAAKAGKSDGGDAEGIWVTNEKMDALMKVSGELIVLKNYFHVLSQEPGLREASARINAKINDFSYSLNKITDHLQDEIMYVRKVTLDRALSKLPRIFRQVTKEVNKKVNLETEGFELGVDRTIANALSSCMTHMLRNALDHGIESAEVRESKGKPAVGTIKIVAKEQKGLISVIMSDDGGGIDPARIVNKAIEKGLLDESKRKTITPSEAFDLIFLPGFSTAEKVTGISGRGVGMDVVKSEITNLKGNVRIESEIGKGTSFHIDIPAPKTVVVEQTVLVRSGHTAIAVPLTAIALLTSSRDLSFSFVGRHRTCQFRGRTIILKTFAEFASDLGEEAAMQSQQNQNHAGSVVILQHRHECFGLLVDSIHDQLEAVVRPFDKVAGGVPGFKGTTVLGNDSVAYVVSPEEFVNLGLGMVRESAA